MYLVNIDEISWMLVYLAKLKEGLGFYGSMSIPSQDKDFTIFDFVDEISWMQVYPAKLKEGLGFYEFMSIPFQDRDFSIYQFVS